MTKPEIFAALWTHQGGNKVLIVYTDDSTETFYPDTIGLSFPSATATFETGTKSETRQLSAMKSVVSSPV